MTKKCKKCGKVLSASNFYKHSQMADGYLGICKYCVKKRVGAHYRKNIEKFRSYDKNRQKYDYNRIFKHRFDSMKNRHPVKMTKADFVAWCYENKNFIKFFELWKNWKNANFIRGLAPSIDRVNNNDCYRIGNLQWLTQSQNISKYRKELKK